MLLSSNGLPSSASGSFSPLRSNLQDMIASCHALKTNIANMNEDRESFGLLTEETYCYDAPEVLTHLHKVSLIAAACTRNIHLDDEAFEIDEAGLGQIFSSFITDHGKIIDALTALGPIMKSTGSLCGAFGTALHQQEVIIDTFQEALNARFLSIKVRVASDWTEHKASMRLCLNEYPLPVRI